MSNCTELLKKAVGEIVRIFKKRDSIRLTKDRGALITPKANQVNEVANFELVTWLIIK
jgi:hypothetical protein